MFALLGIRGVDAHVDVIITGIAIGTGSTPVHSLIGILQQGKDTLDGVQNLLKNARSASEQEITNQSLKPPKSNPSRVETGFLFLFTLGVGTKDHANGRAGRLNSPRIWFSR